MAAVNHAVLVVDDEEHVLRSIKRLLCRDGYEIHLADGGQSALDILASKEIAVIICDQRMPGMPGAEVLAKCYKLRPDTVRITLTGYTDLTAAQASINEGHVNHFLLKPWDDDHLRSVVREGVRAYQMIQDNRRLEEITRRQKQELEAWNHRLEKQVEHRTTQLSAQNNMLRGLQKQLERSLRDTVGVMIGILEASKPNIGIHSKRVAKLAQTLATELDLTGLDLRDVEFAAHLHDIGKVSKIQGEKASRTGRAARSKGHAALRHSDSGHAILSHVAGFGGIAWAVRHQHEHYDGSGYPDRIQGDEIPLASRIIAIVNSYDEAVFSCTYPTIASREAGKKVLLEGQGKRFDPALVDMFLQYLDKEGAHTCDDTEVELSPGQLKVGMKLSRALRNAEGVLLLKPGMALTAENIERIQMTSNIDPVLSSVFVK